MDTMTGQKILDYLAGRFFGKYRGLVSDNMDPAEVGRLKVKVPSILGENEVWALPCVPYAGAGVGFYALPDPGTLVWVEFEAGIPSLPIWTGCFWGDGELPDDSDAEIKVLKTNTCTLRVDDGASEVRIESQNGAVITLSSDINEEAGEAVITIGGGTVVAEAGGAKAEIGNAKVLLNDGALEVV